MGAAFEATWAAARALVVEARDIIDERPDAAAPGWATRRGWVPWLTALDDAGLAACERDGLSAHARRLGAPADLIALAERAGAIRLPTLAVDAAAPPTYRVNPRKRAQVAAFAALVQARFADVARVVDVGAGHGHLTRHLAEALGVAAVGLERDADRVRTARALGGAEFVSVDLFADAPDVRPTDLVVGLHACGALSDRLLDLAATHGAAFAVVGCCLHKIPTATRAPRIADTAAEVHLPRAALGLANINVGARGVEASLAANLAARGRRAGVRRLLRTRGIEVAEGEVMHGLNRRRAYGTFADLAARVLTQRGLPPASGAELAAAEAQGLADHARLRRWAIARRMLGRPLEVYIALDRALSMAAQGHAIDVGILWPAAASPRNIAIVGRR